MPVLHSRASGDFIDMTGETYGRLTVLGYAGHNVGGISYWECVCVCGGSKTVQRNALRAGATTSCGCLNTERITTHGMAYSAEYKAYIAAQARCNNPNTDRYDRWGGRGIEFRFKSFDEFYAELGDRPSERHSVDRFPDKNGHYEKGNVRWATPRQQTNNTDANVLITFDGRTKTKAEWCHLLGVPYYRVSTRLRTGFSFVEAVTTGYMRSNKKRRDALTGD